MAIVLQESLRAVFYAPFYAALALDAYADDGVEVRFIAAPRPGEAPASLMSGAADVVWGGPMRVLTRYDQDPACDLVCFCEVVTRDPFFVVGRTPQPNFALADLARVRLATVSEVPTPWMCLQEDLRRAGVDPDRLDRVADRAMADNVAALRAGKVEAAQLFQPDVETLLDDGAGHLWYAAAERGPCSYTCFYARRGVLNARADELRRMTRAIFRTQKWLHAAAPAAIAGAIRSFFPAVSEARLAAACARYQKLGVWGRNPVLPQAGYARLKAGLLSGGLIRRDTPFEQAVDNDLARRVIEENPPALARRA
jgi:NitT/TauT family transport system substrate-binding protein